MVYFSRTLGEQFPQIVDTLDSHLSCQEIDSSNLWIRDFMPIKTGNSFTKFKYKGYEKYPWLTVSPECWQFVNPQLSDIYLDGGNVVQNEDVVFMTEQVFKNNPTISRPDLKQFLKDRFGKNIIFLPVEPLDDLGHADGIIKFKDNKTVIINDYRSLVSQTWSEYAMKLEKVITDNGFEFIKIPWAYGNCLQMSEIEFRKKYPLADDFNPGYGYYINYYQTKDYIFLPTFGIKQDIEVVKFLRSYVPFQKAIVPVDCSELSMMGGLLLCVTWEY
jgi:agmatine deiminase